MKHLVLMTLWIGLNLSYPVLPTAYAQAPSENNGSESPEGTASSNSNDSSKNDGKNPLKNLRNWICNKCTAKERSTESYTLLFSERGELLSAPPDILFENDNLEFTIQRDDDAYNNRAIELTERIVETVKNLEDEENKEYLAYFGICKSDIDVLLSGLSYHLHKMQEGTSGDTKLHIGSRINFLNWGDNNSRGVISRYIPSRYNSLDKKHELKYRFSYMDGSLDKMNPIEMDSTGKTEEVPIKNSDNKEIEKIIFEIREPDNMNTTIRDWYRKGDRDNPLEFPKDLASQLNRTRSVLSSEKFKTKLEKVKTEFENLKLSVDQLISVDQLNELGSSDSNNEQTNFIQRIFRKFFRSNRNDKESNGFINEITDVIEKDVLDDCQKGYKLVQDLRKEAKIDDLLDKLKKPDSQNWILNWLWLTKGIPKINPFPHQTQPLIADFDLEEEKAKLEFYRQWLENKDTKAEKAEDVAEMIEAMAKAKKNVELYGNPDTFTRDNFLYRGELVVSREDNNYYMLHHNARNRHLNMKTHIKDEILENEKMAVLVHNKNPEVNYILTSTFTSITDNKSGLEGELKRIDGIGTAITSLLGNLKSSNGVGTQDLPEDGKISVNPEIYNLIKATKESCIGFEKEYNDLVDNLKFIQTLQMPPNLPLLLIADQTPNLESKILDYDLDASQSPPYTHKYEIKDDKGEVKYTGNYRINKLYRFRAKIGPMYSGLKRNDYTISANEVTMTQNRHGFDFTAGIQYFVKPINIREKNFKCGLDRTFLYLGMGLMNRPLENWMLGLGWEPIPGMTLTVGGHFGVDERLNTDPAGNLYEQSRIKGDAFGAVTFDLAVFQSFFGISGLFN